MNILVRVLLYLAQSYHEYFQRTCQDYYKSRKVKIPKPELYVIFTGDKGRKPDKISLSKEFFKGADIDIEVKAKVIYESNTDDIINQYIIFCKVFNEQTKQPENGKRGLNTLNFYERNGGRKKFNVNFIVKTGGFLYNRDMVGACCIVSSAELQ